jgi:adenine-specific DNA-methyltransferase
MSIEKLTRPKRIDEERIQKLKELFPEAFADGKLNLEILQEEINGIDEELIESNTEEFYGLQWVGKKEARRLALLPPQGTLKFAEGEGVNEGKTKNFIIEGDNLEILRILQKSYFKKIKLIFIDPPYNTGSDLVYKDDFKDSIESYLRKTSQMDEEGLLTSNPKSNGRYHANWLNMMYPRLRLARKLLRDDGIICITIGEEEVSNLKLIGNEIFGEENFLGCIIWKKKTNGNNVGHIPSVHDYILCYASNINNVGEIGFPISKEYIDKNYSNPDNDPRGPWTTQDLSANHVGPYFPITNPKTGEVFYPPKGRYWVFNEEEVKRRIADGRIIFGKSGNARPVQKVFLYEKKNKKQKTDSLWDKHGFNEDGTEELTKLFSIPKLFSHPKPTKLIKNIVKMFTEPNTNDIIMDFFAGSGTTGHAVLELNEEDDGNRQFILVQIPEPLKSEHYSTISEITKERIRRVIATLESNGNEKSFDRGFEVYKLSRSNLTKWNVYKGENLEILEYNMDIFTNTPFTEGWTEKDVIIELMLNQGFPLDSSIEQLKDIENNTVWTVRHEDVPFSMHVCLDESLHKSTVDHLVRTFDKDVFICLDDALTNEEKIILSETMKVKTI